MQRSFRTDSSQAAEPEFNWALKRYYSDTVKFGGALQFVPGFMAS